MITDPISNFLIAIKNASRAGKDVAVVPYSNLKNEIAKLLEKEGYVKGVQVKGKKATRRIEVEIAYRENKEPRVEDVARLSKPSRRVYVPAKEIRSVKQGKGMLVVSTPKGILRGEEAKKANVGGEALFMIW